MEAYRSRPLRRVCLMALALLLLFLLSFVWGRYDVPLGEVVRILLSRLFPLTQTWTDNMAIAVWNVRMPRILLACLVGCALSAAGAGYQTVFQNPMAAPDILGASSGACFGAALAILTGQSNVMVTVFAFLASLLTVKSLVTVILTAVFAAMAGTGRVTAEQFLTVFTVVIAFYFGTQAEKRARE